jgi:integrase
MLSVRSSRLPTKREDNMAKLSRQRGTVRTRGRMWYGYFEKPVADVATGKVGWRTTTRALGLRSTMTKSQAREELGKIIAVELGTVIQPRGVEKQKVTLGWFVRNRYFPLKEGGSWKTETAREKKMQIERDILDQFGDVPLAVLDKFMLQTHLNRLASEKSADRVKHARYYMKAIFEEAVENEFLERNPARKLALPAELRSKDKTVLTWTEMQAVLAWLPFRDRLLMRLDMSDALRPGELFALRWKCFQGDRLELRETVYRGKIRPFGKTRNSMRPVPLAKRLAQDLWLWKQECPDSSPEAFIFANARGGFVNATNYSNRVLQVAARQLGLPKLTFQVIRRSISTWSLHDQMGTLKDLQGVLRHTRAETTADVYAQIIPEGVRRTVEAIDAKLTGSAGTTENGEQEADDAA